MSKKTTMVAVLLIIFITASFAYSYWNSYWLSFPYAAYKMGEEIVGFPYKGTSMTVNSFFTTPDRTFPHSSTDIWVNITIHSLGSNQTQSKFPDHGESKYLFLTFNTPNGHGEVSAWNGFNDSMGIFTPDNNSSPVNQSIKGSLLFVYGNGNQIDFKIVCRAESQKPLFTVELHNP